MVETYVILAIVSAFFFFVLFGMMIGIRSPFKASEPTSTVRGMPTSGYYTGKKIQGQVEYVADVIPHKTVKIKVYGVDEWEWVDLDMLEPLDKRQALGHTAEDSWIRKDILRDVETMNALNRTKEAERYIKASDLRNKVLTQQNLKMSKDFGAKAIDDARLVATIKKEVGGSTFNPFYSSTYRRPYSFQPQMVRPMGGEEGGE